MDSWQRRGEGREIFQKILKKWKGAKGENVLNALVVVMSAGLGPCMSMGYTP